MHRGSILASWLDPPNLTAMNSMMALSLIDSHNGVFRVSLAFAIVQIEQFSVIEAIAEGPVMVHHGFYQVIFILNLLEGEYSVFVDHHLHSYSYGFAIAAYKWFLMREDCGYFKL